MWRFCAFFLILKVIVFLWPQPGYIHPDEFFQSVEIAANSTLEIDAKLPWEFNSSLERPIRASIWPSVFAAPGLWLLKRLQLIRSPVSIIRFSRIVIFLSSFICDFFVWKLARFVLSNKRTAWQATFFWLSTYTSWTLMPRTLNNSAETLCVVLLIYLIFCGFNTKSSSFLLIRSCLLGFIVTIGVFLRPTFPIFASIPLLFWLYKLFFHLKAPFKCLFAFTFCVLITCFLLILADSFYYRPEFITALFADALNGKLSIDRLKSALVLTPLNFVLYQLDKSNLALHGLHPRYVHALINLPVLLGPIYLFLVFRLFCSFFTRSRPETLEQRQFVALIATLITSLCGISTAPHQEFRFLMPLVPIACLISAHYFQKLKPNSRILIISFHVIFNVSLGFFYGFLHQSTAVRLAENVLYLKNEPTRVLLTCSYTFPNFLLANNRNVRVEDVGTVNKNEALSLLSIISKSSHQQNESVIAILPSYYLSDGQKFDVVATLFPVFSGECLGDLSGLSFLTTKFLDLLSFSVIRL